MSAIRNVLCPVDFTVATRAALKLAEEICRKSGALLVLEHNLEPRPPSFLSMTWMWSEEFEEAAGAEPERAERRLQELLNELAKRVRCEAKLTRGPIDDSLLYLARELPADLVVMASHGRSSAQHRSLTERLVAKAPCAMLSPYEGAGEGAPRLFDDPPARALVYLPGDRADRRVLRYAFERATELPLELELVRAVRAGSQAAQAARAALEAMATAAPNGCAAVEILAGSPAGALVRHAKATAADLILLARHPHRLLDREAHKTDVEVLHSSPCPVWFVS